MSEPASGDVKPYKYRQKPPLWLILLILAFIVAVSFFAVIKIESKPLISSNIKKSVTYVVYVPSSDSPADRQTVKYDSKLKLLSYEASIFGVNTVISEQPTPESFTDVPQAYDKVLDSWKQYDSFDSSQGTVYLTRPGDQGGRQVGVMNSKGTLMFVKPAKDLTGDQWRQFFKSLQISS